MNNLKELNEKALQNQISKIRSAPKGSPIIEANSHLHEISDTGWWGGGKLQVGGVIHWTANCYLGLSDFSTGIKAVQFKASGTGFMIGAVDSTVVGRFIVHPGTVGGDCHFEIASGAMGPGVCTLFLYSTSGSLYGSFSGPAAGLAVGGMSGKGKLTVLG